MNTFLTSATVLVAIATFVVANANPEWDDLRVTWGQSPLTAFTQEPRTVKDAEDAGFALVSSEKCGENGVYNGIAYAKDDDLSVTLLYDINGYIAGIQHGVRKDVADDKGFPSAKIQPPWTLVDGRYVITAYFTDPSTICSKGRSQLTFDAEGTGTDLWIQTGNSVNNVTLIPKYQSDLDVEKWTEGKCFPTMGKHYWYDVQTDTECDAFYPVFLLYNDGKLNSFGWAIFADLDSVNYEHPPIHVLGAFMKIIPTCASSIATRVTTIHIYLTSQPQLNMC